MIDFYIQQLPYTLSLRYADVLMRLQKLSDAHLALKVFVEVLYLCDSDTRDILVLRKSLWPSTFGTPSLAFAVVLAQHIETLSLQILNNAIDTDGLITSIQAACDLFHDNNTPALIEKQYENFKVPNVDPSGFFIPTNNQQGYMITAFDDITHAFVDDCMQLGSHANVLEIGPAYGHVTVAALRSRANVYAIEMDLSHLAVIANAQQNLARGQFHPILGRFPDEVDVPDGFFDAILVSRVLHFFDGDALVNALSDLYRWLKPNGRLYSVNETPFLKNWESFLPEYHRRKQAGWRWPGVINNNGTYENHYAHNLPELLHFMDEESMYYALTAAGFNPNTIKAHYFDRRGQFPDAALLDGRESLGCIALR